MCIHSCLCTQSSIAEHTNPTACDVKRTWRSRMVSSYDCEAFCTSLFILDYRRRKPRCSRETILECMHVYRSGGVFSRSDARYGWLPWLDSQPIQPRRSWTYSSFHPDLLLEKHRCSYDCTFNLKPAPTESVQKCHTIKSLI